MDTININSGILTYILSHIIKATSLGYAEIVPDALDLMKYFIIIDCVMLGIYWSFGKDDIIMTSIKKIISVGFFLWVINNAHYISRIILKSFGAAGIKAGGSTISLTELLDPSSIIDFGLFAVEPILINIGGAWKAITNPFNTIIIGIGCLFILIAYFMIACNIFLVITEFYLVTVGSTFLIPFIIFNPTRFLGEKAISATFRLAIKFMVLALIIGVTHNVLESLSSDFSKISDPSFRDLFTMLLGTAAIAYLSIHAPSLALSLIDGSPALSSGSLVGFGAAAASSAVIPYKATKMVATKAQDLYGQSKRAATAMSMSNGTLNKSNLKSINHSKSQKQPSINIDKKPLLALPAPKKKSVSTNTSLAKRPTTAIVKKKD